MNPANVLVILSDEHNKRGHFRYSPPPGAEAAYYQES